MTDFIDEYYFDKDLSLLKKLTLVIPTHNRNYYLSRCLWYHAHFPFGQIIVADSSPEEKKVVNRETVAKIREMFGANILYLEYEQETHPYGEDIYRKWASAISHATTEYVKLCTDKEFILPETTKHSILFLDEHADYNTADGLSLFLRKVSTESRIAEWDAWQPDDTSYEEEDPLERIQRAFNNLKNPIGKVNCLTAIRRTWFQKWIYAELIDRSLIDIRFGDNLPQILSIVCSKRKHFPSEPGLVRDLSYLYDMNGKKACAESSSSRYPTFTDYVFTGVIDDKIVHMKELITSSLNKFNRYTPNEISNKSKDIVFSYLSHVTGIPTLSKMKWFYSSKLIQILYSKLPPMFSYKMIEMISNIKRKQYGHINYAPFCAKEYKCLQPIEELVKVTMHCHEEDEPIPLLLSNTTY